MEKMNAWMVPMRTIVGSLKLTNVMKMNFVVTMVYVFQWSSFVILKTLRIVWIERMKRRLVSPVTRLLHSTAKNLCVDQAKTTFHVVMDNAPMGSADVGMVVLLFRKLIFARMRPLVS
jgi:hypothetical protein